MSDYSEKRKKFLIKESGLPVRNISNIQLIPEVKDVESFKQLSSIKNNSIPLILSCFKLI